MPQGEQELNPEESNHIELESRYLVTYLPDLSGLPSKRLVDIYLPAESDHPRMRIRQNGENFVITKKTEVIDGDASQLLEQNIALSYEEYTALSEVKGKRIVKTRYQLPINGVKATLDIFSEDLEGLVMADFEFRDEESRRTFVKPDFCGKDVTQVSFLAGGILAGKKFNEIEQSLNQLGN